MNISETLIRPEGKTLEFKRDISSLKPILKTLVAFANTAGGILIIGRESDGNVHGVPEVLQAEERLANAIGHADYSLRSMRILVGIYADRMEVQNPGMLPFGMTMEDLKSGVSKIRNRVIARVFREMGLMEEWGSGYKRVIRACQSGGYPEPDWEELGTAFRVIFHPHPAVLEHSRTSVPVSVPVNDRQRWFLDQLAAGKQIRASDMAVYWSISEKTAKRDIADLKRKALIEFIGAPKNGFYRIMEEVRDIYKQVT